MVFNLIYRSIRLRKYLMLARALFFIKILRKGVSEYENISEYVTANTVFTNKRLVIKNKNQKLKKHPNAKYFLGISLDLSAYKSSLILNALKGIPEINMNKRNFKVLIIGPRNESEIFNFIGAGFQKKNIEAIDLVSYSPLINLGDMHDLKYKENSFDVIYAGWVLAYSENKNKAVDELVRAVNNNKFIVIGWSVSTISNEDIIKKRGYMIGSEERMRTTNDILSLFSKHKVKVVFSSQFMQKDHKELFNDDDNTEQDKRSQIIIILQISK